MLILFIYMSNMRICPRRNLFLVIPKWSNRTVQIWNRCSILKDVQILKIMSFLLWVLSRILCVIMLLEEFLNNLIYRRCLSIIWTRAHATNFMGKTALRMCSQTYVELSEQNMLRATLSNSFSWIYRFRLFLLFQLSCRDNLLNFDCLATTWWYE